MNNVIGSDNSFVTCRKDDSSGDQIDEVDVDEALGSSVLALGQDETQVGVDVLEEDRPTNKVINNETKTKTYFFLRSNN